MPSIQQPKQVPEYVNGKANQVLAVAPVQLLAVSWVSGDGEKSMALVLQFGKDTDDGGPGVFVMADQAQMSEQIKMPNSTIKKGVRAWLAQQQEATPEEIPEGSMVAATLKVPVVNVGLVGTPQIAGDVDITKLDL